MFFVNRPGDVSRGGEEFDGVEVRDFRGVTTERVDGVETLPPFQLPYAEHITVHDKALEFFCDAREGYRHRPKSYVVHTHDKRELAMVKAHLSHEYDVTVDGDIIRAELKAKYKPAEVTPGRYDNEAYPPTAAEDKMELLIKLVEQITRLKMAAALNEPELARVVAQLEGVVIP